MNWKRFISFFIFVILSSCIHSTHRSYFTGPPSRSKEEHTWNQYKSNHLRLEMLMRDMPKGGDLHNHLMGSTYPENLISFHPELSELHAFHDRYEEKVRAWSMKDYSQYEHNIPSGEHFFSTFGKFARYTKEVRGKMLAELVERAITQKLLYLEPSLVTDGRKSTELTEGLTWKAEKVEELFDTLKKRGLEKLAQEVTQKIEKWEEEKDEILLKKGLDPDLVVIRYQHAGVRTLPVIKVFATLCLSFLVQKYSTRVSGMNLVGPEHNSYSLNDFDEHIKMLQFFRNKDPQINFAIHAGEFNPELVAPKHLRNHIQKTAFEANAARIGHGVGIAFEENADEVLRKMASEKKMVEINLTSNEKILQITKDRHPLNLYLEYHVPVALSTDDEGILRTDISREYARAVREFDLTYRQLKQMNRNSLIFSFIEGESLWFYNENELQINKQCGQDYSTLSERENVVLGNSCREFLAKSKKAQIQWQLEKRLYYFERKYQIVS